MESQKIFVETRDENIKIESVTFVIKIIEGGSVRLDIGSKNDDFFLNIACSRVSR